MNRRALLLLLLSFLVYFSNLNGFSIYILDEAKNASCAMEMAQRNDWIVPTFNGELRTDKPPLHYYFMRLAYFVTGSTTPGAARFFSALCGVSLIMLVFRATSRILNEQIAFWAALILLCSVQLSIQFHLAVPDPYLILALTATLFCSFLGMAGNRRAMVATYAFAGLGFLCKGLIAVVIPGLVVLTYWLATKRFNWRSLRQLNLPIGIPLFLILTLPWYVLVGFATDGAWLRSFFLEHNLSRYTSTMEGHAGFPLAAFAILIVALLPFSLAIVPAIVNVLRLKRDHPFMLFALIVVIVVGVFFSISRTILPSYPAPALPFLAIVLAAFLARVVNGEIVSKRFSHILFAIGSTIGLAIPIGVYTALKQEPQISPLAELAWYFAVVPIGSLVAWFIFFKNRTMSLYVLCATWTLVSLLFICVAYPKVDALNPVSQAMNLKQQQFGDLPFVGYGRFNPAFIFQIGHPIDVVNSDEELKTWLERNGDAVIISRKDIVQESEALSRLPVAFSGKDLFERTETVILMSRKGSTP